MTGQGPPIPLLAAVVAIVTVVVVAVTVIIVTGRLDAGSTPAVGTILGFAGTAVMVLLLALQAARNSAGIADVQDKVNGHLDAHSQLAESVATKVVEKLPNGTTGGGSQWPPQTPPT